MFSDLNYKNNFGECVLLIGLYTEKTPQLLSFKKEAFKNFTKIFKSKERSLFSEREFLINFLIIFSNVNHENIENRDKGSAFLATAFSQQLSSLVKTKKDTGFLYKEDMGLIDLCIDKFEIENNLKYLCKFGEITLKTFDNEEEAISFGRLMASFIFPDCMKEDYKVKNGGSLERTV